MSGEEKIIDPYVSDKQPLIICYVRIVTKKMIKKCVVLKQLKGESSSWVFSFLF